MGKFGWSLPPGCSTLPGEEEPRACDACGRYPDEETGARTCADPAACDQTVREIRDAEAQYYEPDTAYLDGQYERDNDVDF